MFGLRLKSWMESHLGRPRQKSSHQNQKNHRALKEAECGAGVGSSFSAATTTTITTTAVTSGGGSLSSSNGNPHPVEHNCLKEQQQQNLCCNLDSSPSSDFSTVTNASPPSSSSVQIQSGSVVQTAQLQKQPANHSTKDYEDDEEKIEEQDHHHHQGTTCTRSSTTGSVSNSTSHNILLGAFCNNLNSPDTGYSTDGYSPKSVYPALSFESSGKSTPKSSYTISSLVSSELHLSSKGNTASLSSASCSVNNGLESDAECASPPRVLLKTSASLPPHSETDRSNLGLGNGIINEKRSSQDSSPRREERNLSGEERNQNPVPLQPSNSISQKTFNKAGTPTRDSFRCNDTVNGIQCNSKKSSVNYPSGEFSSHQQLHPGESGASMVAAKAIRSNLTIIQGIGQDGKTGAYNPTSVNEVSTIFPTNPFYNSNRIQGRTTPSDNNLHNQIIKESLDERKSSASPDSEGNSSSLLTGSSSNRNIRTSFILATNSQIPECSNFGLKNAYSICSPRKERTRIKTNPWITFDGNSNANKIESNSSPVVIRVNKGKGAVHSSLASESSRGTTETNIMHCHHQVCINSSSCINPNCGGGNEDHKNFGETTCDIMNMCSNRESRRDTGMDHQSGDSLSLVYRISTSASASDSGKGSLDLESGTNRNSTESSCLSDSASTRNSMISHEAELGCSRSSSSTSPTSFLLSQHKTGEQNTSSQQQCLISSSQVKVGSERKVMGTSATSAKSTPVSVKKSTISKSYNHNNINGNNENSQLEDQDVTSTSITLPPELLSSNKSASVGAQTNVIMVDKETDILSDWANTDDDGEDEIETDRNDDEYDDEDEDRVTPTHDPSSPDTDTGGRAIFHHSQSTSSVTDIDFGDSSAATAASCTGIAPSSSIFRSHYTRNVNKSFVANNKDVNIGTVASSAVSYHQQNNFMVPQTTCYLPNNHSNNPQQAVEQTHWIESEMFGNPIRTRTPTESDMLGLSKSGVMCPKGIHNANISLSSLYSDASELQDYNANKPSSSSNPIARGALGFRNMFKKIFKKGSCSSHRTSPGSDKVKIPRSAKSKDSHLSNIASITGLRATSLVTTADALVSPHPLVTRKQSINGYFLTPTPNAFRRRSGGTGTDSSDSNKGSQKHHKAAVVKADVIRLPPGALSPTPQLIHANTSSSTASSKSTSISAFCISSLQNNTYAAGNGNNIHGCSNTNTNSTASSIQSMSTSTSASTTGAGFGGENHRHIPSSRKQNERLNDNNIHVNSDFNRQSRFLSSIENGGQHSVHPIRTHSTTRSPQLPALPPPVPQHPYPHHDQEIYPTPSCQSRTSHQQYQEERDFGKEHVLHRPPSRTGPCPYESPRMQNPHHRISSPSFNNYSPIHRLVVTSGAQLLSRVGGPSPNNPSNCASPIPQFHESPHSTSRNGNGGNDSSHHHNNNNPPSVPTPNINRSSSYHPHPTSSPSPLINHQTHQSSVSSPRFQLPPHNTFTSPSPILRNPRYQYIASSNQNSPILNVPKRMNGHTPTPPPPNQQYYYHNQEHGTGSFPNGPPVPPPSFSTFSPTPPPRQITQSNNNPFSTASPNLNHHQLHSQSPQNPCITNSRQQRIASNLGSEFEVVNSPNPNLHRREGVESNSGSSSNNHNKLLSRSQSYQTQAQEQQQCHPSVHYYASQVVSQPIPQTQPHIPQRILPHHVPMHPTSLSFNEPPLLMRAHLHNQNLRLNNFLMNKQRHQQSMVGPRGMKQIPLSESFQERIYETVGSDDDEENSNEDDDEGMSSSMHPNNMRDHCFHTNTNGVVQQQQLRNKNRLPTAISNLESGFPFSNKSSAAAASKSRIEQTSKSKRSKTQPLVHGSHQYHSESTGSEAICQQPRPPVPMALFGPNTFLSETETRLLESDDSKADLKYKRLINEAEALLREISAVKSQQQPWAQPPSRMHDRMRVEDCPQSDPLRRKGYDCWALRRLQQELAGCSASPPVLHRSRMNLQSPSTTPTATAALMNPYFSLIPNSQMSNANFIDNHNQNNVHF